MIPGKKKHIWYENLNWSPIISEYKCTTQCEISSRPIDNVYVISSWSMSNFQNCVYKIQWGPCKIKINWSMIPQNLVSHTATELSVHSVKDIWKNFFAVPIYNRIRP